MPSHTVRATSSTGALAHDSPAGDHFAAAHAGAHGSAVSQWNSHPAPTLSQREAGNYRLGTVNWHGLTLRIENPEGSIREGTGEDGQPWRNVMQAHYGGIAGTRGADGDAVDVFLGPAPESRIAWVINQSAADGSFDEHKVLAGFVDTRNALDAYRFSHSAGWDRFAPPIPVSLDQLRWWLKFGDTSREFSTDLTPPEYDMTESDTVVQGPALTRTFWDSAAMPSSGQTIAGLLYVIRQHDAADGLLLDALTMADITEGAESIKLDALVSEVSKLKPKMVMLQRVMEAAGDTVKPLSMQITDPLRRYGGVQVAVLFELSDGQTITVWFHNPDTSPAKLTPMDSLVSWKWQLNKKDITIVVAPESGRDLNVREVARRVMHLAEKNSAAFAKANVKRAATMAEIAGLRTTLVDRQATLQRLIGQIDVAKVERESRPAAVSVPWKAPGFDPATPEGYAILRAAGEEAMLSVQDTLDSMFQGRLIATRNALRALGWEGGQFQPLSKAGGKLEPNVEHTGLGNNATGIRYYVTGLEGGTKPDNGPEGLRDDLTRTPEELAGIINGWAVESMAKGGALKAEDAAAAEAMRVQAEADAAAGAAQAAASAQAAVPVATQVQTQPEALAAEIAFLKDVQRGARDAMALGDLLAKIEADVQAIAAAGQLDGDLDALANDAITRWVSLDEKANG